MVKPVDEQKETKISGHAMPILMKSRYSNGTCNFRMFRTQFTLSRGGRSRQFEELNTREIDANQAGELRSTVTQSDR